MSLSRRFLLSSLIGSSGVALAQSLTPAQANIGFKADTLPERSESGVGALMPWADSLWAVTYNSHMQGTGYGLGLYRIDEALKAERVHVHNGTHANRLIHRESNQCFIGPYAIDGKGNWKHIPEFDKHRITSTMRHLTDPANRVYFQTMEGVFGEMDVNDLKPRPLFDLVKEMKLAARPHFKGGFTAQNRVVVANNGFYEYGDDQAGLFEFDGKNWNRLSGKPHMDVAARQDMGNGSLRHRLGRSVGVVLGAGERQMAALPPAQSQPGVQPGVADRVDAHTRGGDRALPGGHTGHVLRAPAHRLPGSHLGHEAHLPAPAHHSRLLLLPRPVRRRRQSDHAQPRQQRGVGTAAIRRLVRQDRRPVELGQAGRLGRPVVERRCAQGRRRPTRT